MLVKKTKTTKKSTAKKSTPASKAQAKRALLPRATASKNGKQREPDKDFVSDRDVQLENILKRHKLSWVLEVISVSEIDAEESRYWNGREEAVRLDHVDQIAASILAGDCVLPRIAVVQYKGKLITISGLHRLMAFLRVGTQYVEAYVIQGAVTDDQLQQICKAANTKHGLALKPNEIEQAIVRDYSRGRTNLKDLARDYGYNTERINAILRGWELRMLLSKSGMSSRDLQKINASHLLQLNRVAKYDEPLAVQAAQKVVQQNLSGGELREMIDHVERSRTIETKRQAVSRYKSPRKTTRGKRIKDTGARQRRVSGVHSLERFMSEAENFCGGRPTPQSAQLYGETLVSFRKRWIALRGKIDEFFLSE